MIAEFRKRFRNKLEQMKAADRENRFYKFTNLLAVELQNQAVTGGLEVTNEFLKYLAHVVDEVPATNITAGSILFWENAAFAKYTFDQTKDAIKTRKAI